VTEFVDQEAIELNRRAKKPEEEVVALWSTQEALCRLQGILREKDEKALNGGPYVRRILLIHTDEPSIMSGPCRLGVIEQHFFERPTQFEEAHLIMSYCPNPAGLGGYPCVPLRFLCGTEGP
jgi:hypothetical protein